MLKNHIRMARIVQGAGREGGSGKRTGREGGAGEVAGREGLRDS